eukprot:g33000.t1
MTGERSLPVVSVRTVEQYRVKHKAILAAAGKIANAKGTDDESLAFAIQAKLGALKTLSRFSAPAERGEFTKEIIKFAAQFKTHKNVKIRNLAMGEYLKSSADQVARMNPDERKTFVAEVVQFVATKDGDLPTQFSIAMTVGPALERGDSGPLAAEIYAKFAPILKKSDDARLNRFAPKLEGAARRLKLVGKPVRITGKTVDGKPFDWNDYKGKVVLVDFWATWCRPCVAELPNIKKNYDLYHAKGFEVVGISLDYPTSKSRLEKCITDLDLPWANLYSSDPKASGPDHPMATHYGIMSIPSAFLIDQKGNLVTMDVRGPALGRQLKKLLGTAGSD